MDFPTLKKEIEARPNLDFGAIFDNSIDLFKKVWGEGFLVALLAFLSILPFYFLFTVPLAVGGTIYPETMQSGHQPTWILVVMVFANFITIFGVITINIALHTEFMRICRNKDLGIMEKPAYLRYLSPRYLKKTFLLGLSAFGISILGMLACGLGIFYVAVPISLFTVFYAFNEELSILEIIKSSFALGNKNWLVIFGLMLICRILTNLGILACGVGILFTTMFGVLYCYFVYKDGVGFDSGRLVFGQNG